MRLFLSKNLAKLLGFEYANPDWTYQSQKDHINNLGFYSEINPGPINDVSPAPVEMISSVNPTNSDKRNQTFICFL